MSRTPCRPQAEVTAIEPTYVIRVSGTWTMECPKPRLKPLLSETPPGKSTVEVALDFSGLEDWDTSLLLFLKEVSDLARDRGLSLTHRYASTAVASFIRRLRRYAKPPPKKRRRVRSSIFHATGQFTSAVAVSAVDAVRLVGECVAAFGALLVRPRSFRWGDWFMELQKCGSTALGIVGLISFLVGLILAFQSAIQLRQFGADIFVADLVGLAIFREMGPMMAAIVVAGRTGAAFAAELGNMKAGEEIDALETMGINAVFFLILPRMLALFVMMPLLAIYANFLGIIGGMLVAQGILDIAPAAYFAQMETAVDFNDMGVGLIKSFVFGIIIAFCGCFRGLQADRSSAGIGMATTSAVVTSIVWVIVADALFAVLFNRLGW